MASIVTIGMLWEFAPITHTGFIHQDNAWQSAYQVYAPTWSGISSRPLMRWSWWWQEHHTPSAIAFHTVDFLLHLVNTILVAILVWRLGATQFGIWIASIIFLMNPMQIEPVVYLTARPELFALIGILSTCILLVGELTLTRIVLAIFTSLFAIAGKESAIVLIALIPIIRRHWVTSIIALIILVDISFSVATNRSYGATIGWALIQVSAACRIIFSTVTLVGNTIEFDYNTFFLIAQICAFILLILGFIYSMIIRFKQPLMTIGILWVIAVILIRMTVMTSDSIFHERHFYSGMVGMSLIISSIRGLNV